MLTWLAAYSLFTKVAANGCHSSWQSPVEDLYRLGFKVVAPEAVPDSGRLERMLNDIKRKAWPGRLDSNTRPRQEEAGVTSSYGPENAVCDFWCDEL